MAGSLSGRPGLPREPSLLLALLLVLLLHAAALLALQRLLQPPSLLRPMAPPFYTRTIVPEAPPVQVAAAAAAPVQARPARPLARIRRARPPDASRARQRRAAAAADVASAAADLVPEAPEPPASVPEQAASSPAPEALVPEPAASAPLEPTPEPASAEAEAAAPEPGPVPPASAAVASADPAAEFLATWPSDTRLSYKLGGNYRGELHGDARVLWQRTGTRYHAAVEMSAGLLASLSFSSQGEITAAGLVPEVYEENLRGRRRGVRIGDDVRLHNGKRVPRPEAVQDTASQFVELGHRFSTGQVRLAPGAQVRFAMARPGGIDDWVYDVVGEELLYLPRLGPVPTFHLKPRPLDKPRGPITAEIWYAPSLQYLPVRIKITQGPDTYIDLLVDTIEQR